MDASADATKPFLAEPKYRDSDVSEDWEPNSPRSCQNVRWLLWLVSGIIVLIFTNVATYFLARPSSDYLDKVCPSRTSVWSPIIADVDIKYETVFFNSTVYGDSDPIYRQRPSRGVDEAWNALGLDLPPMLITSEEAVKSGVPLDRVRTVEKDGVSRYPVIVEGLHNLHCLNFLRQALYFNSDKYREWKKGAWANDEDTVQKHIGHCVNMLRMVLMCTVDTGVHPFIWAKTSHDASIAPHVFPDFQRNHKCKSFDTILQQVKARKLLGSGKLDIDPQEDSLILPDWP